MIYLVLSFVAFLFSVFAILFFSKNFYHTDSHTGTLVDLDFMLKFLSTTDIERTELKVAVVRRVTWMIVMVTERGITIELPLVTKHQVSRQKKYIAICAKLGTTVLTKQSDEGVPALAFNFSGNLDEVSAALKSCFAQIFDITDDRKLKFTIYAKRMDHAHLAKKFHSETIEKMDAIAPSSLPVDPSAERNSFTFSTFAAIVFLRPVIILSGFLYGGFVWFCAAMIAWTVLGAVFNKLYGQSKTLVFKNVIVPLQLGLIGYALWSVDQTYLQVIPSVLAGFMIIQNVLALLFKTTQWAVLSVFESVKKIGGDGASFGLIALGLAIIVCNEYLRNAVSFETWAWVYAFAPAGVLAGIVALGIPIIALVGLFGFLDQKEAS